MRQVFKKFLALESASGIILMAVTLLAIVWANSSFAEWHRQLVQTFLFPVNEGLMAIFFLVVGLELKKGFLEGAFTPFSRVALPIIAALGGMLIPASLYFLINRQNAVAIQGWATPVATDIAFAVGVLSLFGKRIPSSLKLFLLALAIFDDLGAILIIAFFYSVALLYVYLLAAFLLLLVLCLLRRIRLKWLTPYFVIGVALWWCLLKAGIHPTLAGVLLAFFIPHSLEETLHPVVAYGIMPIFALLNAGVSFEGLTVEVLTGGVVLGIVAGLFFGKQVGIVGVAWLMVKSNVAALPHKVTWLEFYGVALLCGIGFTMSLFLGTLSFEGNSVYLSQVRVGVILGSILSGLVGALVLQIAATRKNKRRGIVE